MLKVQPKKAKMGGELLKRPIRSSLVAQQVKDLVLSLQQLRSLLWCQFDLWPQELPHVMGAAKKKSTC